jgi:hypothetical protein
VWKALSADANDRRDLSESSLGIGPRSPTGIVLTDRRTSRFRDSGDSYKWYIVGGICLLLARTSLIVGLLWHRATRRKAEAAL